MLKDRRVKAVVILDRVLYVSCPVVLDASHEAELNKAYKMHNHSAMPRWLPRKSRWHCCWPSTSRNGNATRKPSECQRSAGETDWQ